MGKLLVTAADLGVAQEVEIKTNWSWINFTDPKDVTQFQINSQRVVHWSRAEDTEWRPTIIQKAAMYWLICEQPAVTNLVFEYLTQGRYQWDGSCPKGKEERAERIVEVWKAIATKYRGVLDGN